MVLPLNTYLRFVSGGHTRAQHDDDDEESQKECNKALEFVCSSFSPLTPSCIYGHLVGSFPKSAELHLATIDEKVRYHILGFRV